MILFITCIFILSIAFFIYCIVVEPRKLKVRHVSIRAEVPFAYTLVHFTDTHFTPKFIKQMGDKIREEINAQDPACILFSGDLIDHFECYPQIQNDVETFLQKLEATHGKYAVYGNHDIGGGAKNVYASIMKKGGFEVLCNQTSEVCELQLALFGIDDCVAGYEDLTITEQKLQPFQVFLSHEPDVCERMDLHTIQLMISGHTHGGQLYLPLLSRKVLPKGGKHYRKGRYEIGQTMLYVSSGIGTTKLPMRFRNTPELIVYHIQPKTDRNL